VCLAVVDLRHLWIACTARAQISVNIHGTLAVQELSIMAVRSTTSRWWVALVLIAALLAPVSTTTPAQAAIPSQARADANSIIQGPSALSAAQATPEAGSGKIEIVNPDRVPYNDWLTFYRIQNSGRRTHRRIELQVWNRSPNEPLRLSPPTITGPDASSFAISIGGSGYNNILPGESRIVRVDFTGGTTGSVRGERYAFLNLPSSDASQPNITVRLAGFNQVSVGGDNEPTLQESFDVFGYPTVARYPNQGNDQFAKGAFGAHGDEVISTNGIWVRANPERPVYVRYLVATHGDSNGRAWDVPFRIIPTSGSSCAPNPVPDVPPGSSSGCVFWNNGPDWHEFLPPIYIAATSPSSNQPAEMYAFPTGNFRIDIHGYDSTRHVSGQTQGLRFYPVRDRSGNTVPNTYLVGQDYATPGLSSTNYDYQDGIYLVTNIRPTNVLNDHHLPGLFPGSPSLVLEFDRAVASTLADKSGQGTGFRNTQRNKLIPSGTTNYTGADVYRPDLPPTLSYDAGKLDLNTGGQGTLTISTTNGTNANTVDSLVNGLCMPFDARAAKFVVQTRMVAPFTLNRSVQQTGIMFGPNQYEYTKLALQSTSGGTLQLQLGQELGSVFSQVGTLVTLPAAGSITSLDLQLTGDPATGTIEAAYSVNGGALQTLPGKVTLNLPERGRFFDRDGRGCIMALHRDPAPAFTATFDRFAITLAPELTAARPVIARYNTGGGTVQSFGQTWQSDSGLYTPGNSPNESQDLGGVVLEPIYRSYRGQVPGAAADQRYLTYNIPLGSNPPDQVGLRLHFVEQYWGLSGRQGPNRRLFDVYAEGRLVLNDFDIFSAAGAARTPVMVPIENIPVSGSSLTLTFHAINDNVSISGIEVLRGRNAPPIVDAGADRTVAPGTSVQLSGSASDPENTALTYSWTQIGGPSVTLNGATTLSPSFTPTVRGAYTFRLSVTDADGESATDAVTITANNSPTVTASATPATVDAGQPSQLRATGSDSDGDTLTYSWAQTDGPTGGSLSGAATATATFTPPTGGTYTFTVTVEDGNGGTASATVTVTARNRVPTVTASATPAAVDVGQPSQLKATGSDPDGDALTYSWVQTGGPDSGALLNGDAATASFTPAAKGTYTFAVTADDGNNGTATATVTLTARNRAPVANAGANTTVGVGTSVRLDGRGSSDPDNDSLTYAWTQTGGPTVTLTGATTAQPSFTAPSQPAALTFRLVVTDNEGLASAPATVTVTAAEIAIAGLSATSSSPTVLGQPTTFSASVSAGTNVTYRWDFGGGSTATGATAQFTFPTAGQRTVTLTASNSLGNASTSVLVTVTNAAPTANPGANQTVTVGSTVTLNGSGSGDPDGHTPLTYAWTQTGGSAVTLSSATAASPTFTAPAAPSVLSFDLVVTDSTGLASQPATVLITVQDSAPQNVTATNNSPTVLGQATRLSATATGSNLVYTWTLGDGNTATGATVNHTYAAEGSYVATVTVSNGSGTVGTASTGVTVTNAPPTANAGPDQGVELGAAVSLDASGSSDPDGHTPLTYAWTQLNGPAVTLRNGTSATATFTAPNQQTSLVFQVTVTDSRGKSATDTVRVAVGEEPIAGLQASGNGPTVLGRATSFTASVSAGGNVAYSWSFGDGNTATGASVQHTYQREGSFTVTLTAANSRGTMSRSLTVVVTNAAPTANAGVDQTVLVGTSVTLRATASDPDGHTPLTYAWTQTSGPAVTLQSGASATATFTAPAAEATLVFRLTVTDSRGKSATDTITIAVRQDMSGPNRYRLFLPSLRTSGR